MIPVDLSVALGVYLVVTLGWVAVYWFVSESRKRGRDFISEDRCRWECGLCLEKYIDSVAENFSRCPSCGHLNRRRAAGTIKGGR